MVSQSQTMIEESLKPATERMKFFSDHYGAEAYSRPFPFGPFRNGTRMPSPPPASNRRINETQIPPSTSFPGISPAADHRINVISPPQSPVRPLLGHGSGTTLGAMTQEQYRSSFPFASAHVGSNDCKPNLDHGLQSPLVLERDRTSFKTKSVSRKGRRSNASLQPRKRNNRWGRKNTFYTQKHARGFSNKRSNEIHSRKKFNMSKSDRSAPRVHCVSASCNQPLPVDESIKIKEKHHKSFEKLAHPQSVMLAAAAPDHSTVEKLINPSLPANEDGHNSQKIRKDEITKKLKLTLSKIKDDNPTTKSNAFTSAVTDQTMNEEKIFIFEDRLEYDPMRPSYSPSYSPEPPEFDPETGAVTSMRYSHDILNGLFFDN